MCGSSNCACTRIINAGGGAPVPDGHIRGTVPAADDRVGSDFYAMVGGIANITVLQTDRPETVNPLEIINGAAPISEWRAVPDHATVPWEMYFDVTDVVLDALPTGQWVELPPGTGSQGVLSTNCYNGTGRIMINPQAAAVDVYTITPGVWVAGIWRRHGVPIFGGPGAPNPFLMPNDPTVQRTPPPPGNSSTAVGHSATLDCSVPNASCVMPIAHVVIAPTETEITDVALAVWVDPSYVPGTELSVRITSYGHGATV